MRPAGGVPQPRVPPPAPRRGSNSYRHPPSALSRQSTRTRGRTFQQEASSKSQASRPPFQCSRSSTGAEALAAKSIQIAGGNSQVPAAQGSGAVPHAAGRGGTAGGGGSPAARKPCTRTRGQKRAAGTNLPRCSGLPGRGATARSLARQGRAGRRGQPGSRGSRGHGGRGPRAARGRPEDREPYLHPAGPPPPQPPPQLPPRLAPRLPPPAAGPSRRQSCERAPRDFLRALWTAWPRPPRHAPPNARPHRPLAWPPGARSWPATPLVRPRHAHPGLPRPSPGLATPRPRGHPRIGPRSRRRSCSPPRARCRPSSPTLSAAGSATCRHAQPLGRSFSTSAWVSPRFPLSPSLSCRPARSLIHPFTCRPSLPTHSFTLQPACSFTRSPTRPPTYSFTLLHT